MFIIETNNAFDESVLKLFRLLKREMGFIPEHFKLFATLDPKGFESFMQQHLFFKRHPNMGNLLLPLLRFTLAKKERREYCINLNATLLEKAGIETKQLREIEAYYEALIGKEQSTLLQTALKALYQTKSFSRDDIDDLKTYGFDHHDFYQLLNYATTFLAKTKMIEVYLRKKA